MLSTDDELLTEINQYFKSNISKPFKNIHLNFFVEKKVKMFVYSVYLTNNYNQLLQSFIKISASVYRK